MSDWLSLHFFYAGDRDDLLLNMVAPAVRQARNAGLLKRFFFLRYDLGGPHVRLRLGLVDPVEDLECTLRAAAEDYFARQPSIRETSDEELHRINRHILANDLEGDDALYPNDSVQRIPFRPEIRRYGGAALLEASFDYFHASSQRAFAALEALLDAAPDAGGVRRTRRLTMGLHILAEQVVGLFEGDPARIATLLEALPRSWRQEESILIQRGDAAFQRSTDDYRSIVENVLEALTEDRPPNPSDSLLTAARTLANRIVSAPADHRREIVLSQIHLTANRLGLLVAEEIYLSRILWSAVREL